MAKTAMTMQDDITILAEAVIKAHGRHCRLREKDLEDNEFDTLCKDQPMDCADYQDYNYCGNCSSCKLFVSCNCNVCKLAKAKLKRGGR